MLWLNASREKIKSDHPGISITDLSKKAGEIWKGMSKEKKEVRGSGKEGSEKGSWVQGVPLLSNCRCTFAYISLRSACACGRSGTARPRMLGGSMRKP